MNLKMVIQRRSFEKLAATLKAWVQLGDEVIVVVRLHVCLQFLVTAVALGTFTTNIPLMAL